MNPFPDRCSYRTFGVEFEFHTDTDDLTRWLYNLNLVGSSEKHGYHCDCNDVCNLRRSGYMFKSQRDSSCGGELITGVFRANNSGWKKYCVLTDLVQLGCIETNTVPGLNAGVHVHVNEPEGQVAKRAAFAAFFKWEPTIMAELARGRWTSVRSFNRTMREDHYRIIDAADRTGEPWVGTQTAINAVVNNISRPAVSAALFRQFVDSERHCNLNMQTSYDTWEYRLWNSTRSAWRMRAYVLWSLAISDPDVARDMVHGDPTTTSLGSILLRQGYTLGAAYWNRQLKSPANADPVRSGL